MTNPNENAGTNIGIDVGKFQLDIYILERDRHFSVDNTPAGIKEALKVINRFKVSRIVLEATGRYELEFATAALENMSSKSPTTVLKRLKAGERWKSLAWPSI